MSNEFSTVPTRISVEGLLDKAIPEQIPDGGVLSRGHEDGAGGLMYVMK